METNVIEHKIKTGQIVIVSKSGKSCIWKDIGVVAEKGKEGIGKKLSLVSCKKCNKCFKYESHNTGTTHLFRHVAQCKDKPSTSTKQLKLTFGKPGAPSLAKEEVLNSVVGIVVKDLRPFNIVSSEAMKHLAQTLINVGAKYGVVPAGDILPDRRIVSSHVKALALDEKRNY